MKKSIFIAVLGLAAGIASSYGQGSVFFSTYTANSNAGATVSFASDGTLVGTGYTAQLYYFLGTASDPVSNASLTSITAAPTGLTLLSGVSAAIDNSGSATGATGLGYFDGGTVTIPGYTSGAVTFEIVVYNGSSYANSTIRGRSGSWVESLIQPSTLPAGNLGDNGTVPNFFVGSVAPVPEPTTLALAGLGGLASLVAFRRKQA